MSDLISVDKFAAACRERREYYLYGDIMKHAVDTNNNIAIRLCTEEANKFEIIARTAERFLYDGEVDVE